MIARVRKCIDWLLPGRLDGLVLVIVLLSCLLSLFPWLFSKDLSQFVLDGITAISLPARQTVSDCLSAFALALLSLLGWWVVFSDRTIWYRFFMGLGISLIPAIAFAQNLRAATFPAVVRSPVQLSFVQRWSVVCCFALLGVFLQSVSRWRIFVQNKPTDSPKQNPISISQISFVIACIAISLSLFRALRPANMDYAWRNAIAFGSFEVFLTFVSLVLPTLLSFTSVVLRKWFPLVVLAIGIVIGIVSRRGDQSRLIVTPEFIVFLSTLIVGLLLFRRWGFTLAHLRRKDLWQTSQSAARHRWSGWLVALPLFFATVFLHASTDVRAFIYASSFYGSTRTGDEFDLAKVWRFARIAKRMNAIVGLHQRVNLSDFGTDHRSLPGMEWGRHTRKHSIHATTDWAIFSVNGIVKQHRVLSELAELDLQSIVLHAPIIGPKILDELAKHPNLVLDLSCKAIDEAGFERLCSDASLRQITFASAPSIANLGSLRKAEDLEHVSLGYDLAQQIEENTILFPSEQSRALEGLPLISLPIRFENSADLDFERIKGENLVVGASSIDDTFVEKVNQLAKRTDYFSLQLLDCPMSPAVIESLAGAKVSELRIHLTIGDSKNILAFDWSPLGTNSHVEYLSIEGNENDWDYERGLNDFACAKLSVAAGRQLMYTPYTSPRVETPLRKRIVNSSQAIEQVYKEVAIHHETDETGSLSFLDLNWIAYDLDTFKELGAIQSLRGLRFGYPYTDVQTRAAFSQSFLNLCDNPNWEVLECPSNGPISDASLAQIAKLRNLRRLVLPICRVIPNPDSIPFPVHCIRDYDLRDALPLRTDRPFEITATTPGYDPNVYLTAMGVQNLATAKNLESLVAPGYLLNEKTLTVFESLPKLRELHLVCSLADEASIRRLGSMSQLKELTVGVDEEAVTETLEILSKTKLELLQLFVYSNELFADKVARQEYEPVAKSQTPGIEFHLVVLPKDLK